MAKQVVETMCDGRTSAQLKEAIDRGKTADKVDFPDPAASPLGTDAEAGGASPTGADVAQALRHEVSPARQAAREPPRSAVPVVITAALACAVAAVISYLVLA